jgi:hypothetical protein
MTWTISNLIIETIAGVAGAHLTAAAFATDRTGAWRTIAGVLGGITGGFFLQQFAAWSTTGGELKNTLLQLVIGGIAGALALPFLEGLARIFPFVFRTIILALFHFATFLHAAHLFILPTLVLLLRRLMHERPARLNVMYKK